MDVKIKLIDGGKMPVFKHKGDACADCYARVMTGIIIIPPFSRMQVKLGFACAVPEDYEVQIRPRSGNSKNGIDIAFGTGDSVYRGEYEATVINDSNESFTINDGDRICQMAIRPVPKFDFVLVSELDDTERGVNGFGSSGNR